MNKFWSRIFLFAVAFLLLLFFSNDFGIVNIQKTAIVVAVGLDVSESDAEKVDFTAQIAMPASSSSGGGAIFVDMTGRQNDAGATNFQLTGSNFAGNTTGTYGGGAVYFCGYTSTMDHVSIDAFISDNFFSDNSTTGDGGAIRLTEDSDGGFYSFFMSLRINVLNWAIRKQEVELRLAPVSLPGNWADTPAGGIKSSATPGIGFNLELNTFSENNALQAGGVFS